ncbi:MAG TPA: hypothetical protein EYN66_14175 [Myxococcales bacterium]|nr:hypothetical protein [Myxococcales bacterium]
MSATLAPQMREKRIRVIRQPYVAAWYHLLSAFNLSTDPKNCFNPNYHDRLNKIRPESTEALSRYFGDFHALYRSANGRRVIHWLPLISENKGYTHSLLTGLSELEAPPADLPALSRRAVAPIADSDGAALLQWITRCIAEERACFWDLHFADREAALNTLSGEFAGYLSKHMPRLVNALYGDISQEIVVFVAEALGRKSRSVQPDQRVHHVALMPQGQFEQSMFHILLALIRRKSDKVIRHHFPEGVQNTDDDPAAEQMRFDAAMTATHQLLLRHGQEHIAAFKEWAQLEYQNTPRHPVAAVAALDDLMLIPDDAGEAILNLVTGNE